MKETLWGTARNIIRIAGLTILILLVSADACTVRAEEGKVYIQNVYQEDPDRLHILCTDMGGEYPAEDAEVSMDGQSLSVESVMRLNESPIPMSFYCLVDISGSMAGKLEQAQEILYTICDGMEEGDNIVIGKMGNQIVNSPFLTDKEEIRSQIEGLTLISDDTNLYAGIVEAIHFLEQEKETCPMRCILILSDGEDWQDDGLTWDEAYKEAGESNLPIYTAALLSEDATKEEYESAKTLGSFARVSAGGEHFPKSDKETSSPILQTGQEVGQEILNDLMGTLDICVDLPLAEETGKERYQLSVTFLNGEGGSVKGSREIDGDKVVLPKPEPPEPPEPEPTYPWLWPALAAVLAAAALVCALMARQKKRKEEEKRKKEEEEQRQKEEEQRRQEEERRQQEELERKRLEEQQKQQEEMERRRKEEAKKREEAYLALPRLKLCMTPMIRNAKEKTVWIHLVQGYDMPVGRTKEAGISLDESDSKLSGIHFILHWNKKGVYVWDAGSRNGTSLNGVPISHLGKVALHSGDLLYAGSYEYRVTWETRDL